MLVQICCREFLPQGATMTGLFLVATIVLWRRAWPRWGLVVIAVLTLAIATPYASKMVETGHGITQPLPTAAPSTGPMRTPSPSASGQG